MSCNRLESLSLFFPCHNEEANVDQVMDDALQAAIKVADQCEVIIVDDGSLDATASRVRLAAEKDPRIRLLQHPVNRGYGEALKSGFRAARFQWVFYSDGDGQFDLTELARMIPLTKGADIVSGYRVRRADPWHRTLNARIFGMSLRLFMGLDIPDVDCAFKLYRREIFDRITLRTSGALIDAEVLAKARRQGYRIATLGVTHRPRRAGAQSGAKAHVIFRALKEFWQLWWDLQQGPRASPSS